MPQPTQNPILTNQTALSDDDWRVAHDLAQQLVDLKTDHSSLSSALTYFLSIRQRENAVEQFVTYLRALATHEEILNRSERTSSHNKNIHEAYHDYLADYADSPERLAHILGWAARLMRYYKVAWPNRSQNSDSRTGQASKKHKRDRMAYQEKPVPAAKEAPSTVTVVGIKKDKITLQFGLIKIPQTNADLAKKLKIGQRYNAEVTTNPDGTFAVKILDKV